MSRVIETRTEALTLGDDGVLRCRIKPTDLHTLADAVENVRARLSLIGEARVPTLLDARATREITREAREYYTGPETAKVTLGMAMLVGSSVGRMIGNFLIQVNRPHFPIRLFADESEALRWLSELRAGSER
jgi:hypothetical protein